MSDATPRIWHSLSMDAAGDVIVAGEAPGNIRVSRDSGATWTAGNSPSATWISSTTSSDGSRIYAVTYGGGTVYRSLDKGTTWTSLLAAAGAADWEGIATSADGTKVVAVAQNGPLKRSLNGGDTWTTVAMPDAQANHYWRSVAMSTDGTIVVAVSHNGEVFRSTDSGATWQAVTVKVGTSTTPILEAWYRVKVSSNGQTIALVANKGFGGGYPSTGVYVSSDGGATWTKGFDLTADYTFLAMSANGQVIAASVSNTTIGTGPTATTTPGRVVLSTNAGTSFTQLTMPGASTDWRAVAMSATADRLAAATGNFATSTAGLLYTAH